MKKIPLERYLGKHKINNDRIINMYIQILKMLHEFVKKYKLGNSLVVVSGNNLIRAVVDFFTDVVRIKELHSIKKINKEKIISYTAYWLLKRKPLQAVKDFDGCEFINELFVCSFITSIISRERKIDNNMKNKNPSFGNFHNMLFYNLKYRLVTQQSFELMIEAFFCGCDFPKN